MWPLQVCGKDDQKPGHCKGLGRALPPGSRLSNGYYDYSKEDVYNFLNKDIKREICIYARVSTNKQKNDLEDQIELLKQYCFTNGLQI
ncbi:MAG: recombinase family protein, partial [Desulfovibrio sp.]|nr:recombinase family protein [Desulfovibrio sp.]